MFLVGQDRQLGGLLDSVAGLRLCVGYPASRLVNQARYALLYAEIRISLLKIRCFLRGGGEYFWKLAIFLFHNLLRKVN